MEISFKNKRALVTGAATGIGKAISLKLAECGATVVALDMSQENLEKLKTEIPNCETIVCNISQWQSTKSALEKAFPVDLLVNNAGVVSIEPITEVTEQCFDRTFNVNIKGLYNITQSVVQDLLKRDKPGAIVNISSQASKAGLLNHSLYCSTKGAVDALTRSLALELGPKNIRVNCVNPTVVMTELGKKVWSDPKVGEPMLAKIPLGRFAEVDDVANAVVYVLSDKAAMVTGHCFAVDGGFLAC